MRESGQANVSERVKRGSISPGKRDIIFNGTLACILLRKKKGKNKNVKRK